MGLGSPMCPLQSPGLQDPPACGTEGDVSLTTGCFSQIPQDLGAVCRRQDLCVSCGPYFSSVWCSSGSLTSSSSTRWPKGSEEMDTMLDRMTLLSLLPVRTSWSWEWL